MNPLQQIKTLIQAQDLIRQVWVDHMSQCDSADAQLKAIDAKISCATRIISDLYGGWEKIKQQHGDAQ